MPASEDCVSNFDFAANVDLSQSQWWSEKQLEEFQNFRLRRLIDYAYHNIEGYHSLFDSVGLKPKDIQTKEDLLKIPITTREEMQNNAAFRNNSLVTNTLYTGGSTGTSLKYFESELAGKVRWNVHLRGWSWNGYHYGKNKLAIIASDQGVITGTNTLNLIGELTAGNLQKNADHLCEFQPEHLRGYTSSIFILAKYLIDNGIRVGSVKSINTISENIYPSQRSVIEQAFEAKVFEEYCCNDGGACAWECEKHSGLHHAMERAIIEDVDGEMVVTDLWNLAMPFIRYRNGDKVVFLEEKCSCGRVLPLIKVKGRDNDVIITPKGAVSPTYLMFHGIKYNDDKGFRSGFRAVQYVQKDAGLIEINIVKNSWCTDAEVEEFQKELRPILPGMEIRLNFPAELPTTKKGKRSFIINEDAELLKRWNLSQG